MEPSQRPTAAELEAHLQTRLLVAVMLMLQALLEGANLLLEAQRLGADLRVRLAHLGQAARGGAHEVLAAPEVVGAVARESLEPRQRARFESALKQKIDWFGSRLLDIRFAEPAARGVADELTALRDAGAGVLIVAGASALDPLDPVFGGLTLLGATMERHGAPAPGLSETATVSAASGSLSSPSAPPRITSGSAKATP